jgi:hypothetical protein
VPRVDWAAWLRLIERKRRAVARPTTPRPPAFPPDSYFAAATDASFRLDGIPLSAGDLTAALARGSANRACRSRLAQRLRNHVAILRHVELLIRRCQPVGSDDVVRWYTSVSCGLSSSRLDGPSAARLEQVVRQINSPHLRLRPAVEEIARLHVRLLSDPLVPGFNGILARLMLRCHLGRCGLPPVVFDADRDGRRPVCEATLLPRLLELILDGYDVLRAV